MSPIQNRPTGREQERRPLSKSLFRWLTSSPKAPEEHLFAALLRLLPDEGSTGWPKHFWMAVVALLPIAFGAGWSAWCLCGTLFVLSLLNWRLDMKCNAATGQQLHALLPRLLWDGSRPWPSWRTSVRHRSHAVTLGSR
jgi:hypothetical protein